MFDENHEHIVDADYSDYRTDTHTHFDEGVLVLPVAGPPGTPPKIVRTHAPHVTRRVNWIAEKLNAKPKLPHWNTSNGNDILVSAHFNSTSPAVGANHLTFRADGIYVYASAAPSNMDNISLPMGAPPNVNRSVTQNTYTISAFSQDILRNPDNGRG